MASLARCRRLAAYVTRRSWSRISTSLAFTLAPGGRHRFCEGPPPPSVSSYRYSHSSAVVLNYRKQLATQEGANEFLSSLTEIQRSNLNSALTWDDRENGKTGERERERERYSYNFFLVSCRGGPTIMETITTT